MARSVRSLFPLAAILLVGALAAAAEAKTKVSIGVHVGAPWPAVVHPAPVVVAPPRVVYLPRPVRVPAAPVVVAPVGREEVERVWVPAVVRDQIVGYDPFLRPIVRKVVVSPGRYRDALYRVAPDGRRVFVGWLVETR